MIGILNYRIGNLQNLKNAFEVQSIPHQIFDDPKGLDGVEKIVIPGVVAFEAAMSNLKNFGFVEVLQKLAKQGMPILGVCVGMQILFEQSEENGLHKGLGLIPGRVERFKKAKKIPHTGWNQVHIQQQNPIFLKIENDAWFYFVHSYSAFPTLENKDYSCGVTDYEEDFISVVAKGKVVGCQFHPEKSQKAGLQFLKNFSEL